MGAKTFPRSDQIPFSFAGYAALDTRAGIDEARSKAVAEVLALGGGLFTQDGVGAVEKSIRNRIKHEIYLSDFLSEANLEDEEADHTAGLTAAATYLQSTFGGGVVRLPKGTFNFNWAQAAPIGIVGQGVNETKIRPYLSTQPALLFNAGDGHYQPIGNFSVQNQRDNATGTLRGTGIKIGPDADVHYALSHIRFNNLDIGLQHDGCFELVLEKFLLNACRIGYFGMLTDTAHYTGLMAFRDGLISGCDVGWFNEQALRPDFGKNLVFSFDTVVVEGNDVGLAAFAQHSPTNIIFDNCWFEGNSGGSEIVVVGGTTIHTIPADTNAYFEGGTIDWRAGRISGGPIRAEKRAMVHFGLGADIRIDTPCISTDGTGVFCANPSSPIYSDYIAAPQPIEGASALPFNPGSHGLSNAAANFATVKEKPRLALKELNNVDIVLNPSVYRDRNLANDGECVDGLIGGLGTVTRTIIDTDGLIDGKCLELTGALANGGIATQAGLGGVSFIPTRPSADLWVLYGFGYKTDYTGGTPIQYNLRMFADGVGIDSLIQIRPEAGKWNYLWRCGRFDCTSFADPELRIQAHLAAQAVGENLKLSAVQVLMFDTLDEVISFLGARKFQHSPQYVPPSSGGGGGLTQELGTWVPVWGATTTAPILADGTINGNYVRIGDLVTARVRLEIGTLTNLGAGEWTFSLPFAMQNHTKCHGAAQASAGNRYAGIVGPSPQADFPGTNQNTVIIVNGAGGANSSWKAAVPLAWAATHVIEFSITYLAIPL